MGIVQEEGEIHRLQRHKSRPHRDLETTVVCVCGGGGDPPGWSIGAVSWQNRHFEGLF